MKPADDGKAVRGNKDHVSDIVLDKPIRAQDWRLDVLQLITGLHGGQFSLSTGRYLQILRQLIFEKCCCACSGKWTRSSRF